EQIGEGLQQELGRGAGLLAIAERTLGRPDGGRRFLVAGFGRVGVEPGTQLGIGAEELGAEILAEAFAGERQWFQGRASDAGTRSNTPSGSIAAGSNRNRRFRNDSCSSTSLRCSLRRRRTVGGRAFSRPGRNSFGSSYWPRIALRVASAQTRNRSRRPLCSARRWPWTSLFHRSARFRASRSAASRADSHQGPKTSRTRDSSISATP